MVKVKFIQVSNKKKLCDLFGGELNYPIGKYSMDIFLRDKNIDLEYSGSGHDLSVKLNKITKENFYIKEQNRCNFINSHGIKIIEFVSKTDKIPDDNIIIHLFNKAYNQLQDNQCDYIKIDLDTIF